MKLRPELQTIVGSSHQAVIQATLLDAAGTVLADLPIAGGSVSASSRFGGRWSASVDVVGQQWAPRVVADPLSGFTGARIRFTCGALVDTAPATVDVCELLVNGATVTREKGLWTVTVDCVDVLEWVAQAAPSTWKPLLDETCQDMIRRVVAAHWPPGWPAPVFTDTTTPTLVPLGAVWDDTSPADVLFDLVSIANISLYADHDQTVVMRDPLPTTPGAPVRTLDSTVDVVRYEVAWGREQFANAVRLVFEPVGRQGRSVLRSDWTYVQQSGAPTQGQMRAVSLGGDQWELRVHNRDRQGRRRVRGLDRASQGDLMVLSDDNDGQAVVETRQAQGEDTYVTFTVRLISGSMNLTQNTGVELRAWVDERDPIVGYAEQTSGALAVATVGRVLYEQSIEGEVTQAQADARAAAMLAVQARGFAGHVVEAAPDYRLEPDDDLEVLFADGTSATSRVTEIELPLTVGDPMRVAVRPFTDQGA